MKPFICVANAWYHGEAGVTACIFETCDKQNNQTLIRVYTRFACCMCDIFLHTSRAESAGSIPARRIRRLFSFQRHLLSSRLLRGAPHLNPLHILDEDYCGQAKCMLEKVGSWNFDIFLFDRLTNGNSLVFLTFNLLNQYGLIELFQLDMVKLRRFLVLVQEDYHNQNPYHNAVHAADVTQAMHCYLREPKLAQSLTSFDILLGLLAAATHDLDHPGVNQPFLIKTNHYLAALYRNTSVLENHHWRSAVGLLRETELFSNLPAEDSLSIERQLGSLILATDISRQNEYLSRFRTHLDENDLCLGNASHRHFVLQMALKCADICNPCRPWELSKQWSEKVTEEFFHQGDIEKKHKLEISPLCDSEANTIASVQIGLADLVISATRFHDLRGGASVCRVGALFRHAALSDNARPFGPEQGQLECHGARGIGELRGGGVRTGPCHRRAQFQSLISGKPRVMTPQRSQNTSTALSQTSYI
ncbi:hypothetical protein cypCar_00008792 [Cyprinus carpio]|nr:hypothetical protein cypCar_00008792 [Cyprinus carpio]